MNLNEKTLARLLFRDKVLTAGGTEYEDLFTRVMQSSRPDFRQVNPQGPFGDRKNDGFEPRVGRYFQVYSPVDCRSREWETVRKIEDDIRGLVAYWAEMFPSGVRELYFVLNDRYRSVYASTYETLERVRVQYALAVCEPFLARNLEDELFSLSDERITNIVGFIPSPEEIRVVDYSLLGEVISHVLANPVDITEPGRMQVPDFEKKIVFNDIRATGPLLVTASYQTAAVEEYFSANSEFVRQTLREILNGHYLEVKSSPVPTPDGSIAAGDQQLIGILQRITPVADDPRKRKEMQEAALTVMAVFFETCDIFEDPEA